MTFAFRKDTHPTVTLIDKQLPEADEVKCIGTYHDLNSANMCQPRTNNIELNIDNYT